MLTPAGQKSADHKRLTIRGDRNDFLFLRVVSVVLRVVGHIHIPEGFIQVLFYNKERIF